MWSVRCALEPVGGPEVRNPQQHVGGLPDGICEAVHKIYIPLMHFELACCAPSLSLPSVIQFTLVFWMG